MRRRFLLPLLVLSGFAGLAYELLWVRMLALAMGSTTASFSTVLAVFFGGLALGSWWAGKRVLSATRPVAAYAAIELLTGLLALGLLPLMKNLGGLFALLDPGPGPAGVLVRVVVAALLLLPPTFLMGASLPFVCLASIASESESRRGTALIYGFNTLGACAGAYGLTFWLLPGLGISGSTFVVAAVNGVVAMIAFVASRRSGGDGPLASLPPPSEAQATASEDGVVMLTTFIGGLAATGAQVIWARHFAIALRGTSYGLGSVLTSVLIGIAIGSLAASRVARLKERVAIGAAAVQLLFIAGLALFASAASAFFYVSGTLPNAGLSGKSLFHAQALLVWVTLAIPTIASGASLPLLVGVTEHSARAAGRSLARVYAANTVGCILGSVSVGYFLLPGLGSARSLYLLALLAVLGLTLFALRHLRERRVMGLGLIGLAVAIFAVFPSLDARLDQSAEGVTTDYFTFGRQLDGRSKRTAFQHEGDAATVVVSGSPTQGYAMSLNGLGQGGRAMFVPQVVLESALVGLVPWIHSAHPDRGLVVGLGAGGTLRTLLDLGVKDLEVLELERGVIEGVETIWGSATPLDDQRTHLILNDARHHLLVQSRVRPGSYDFITSMPAHPWVAPSLFTEEFFTISAKNLKDDGIFAVWFGTSGLSADAVEGLFGAFFRVFPHYAVYWVAEAGAFYLVGSRNEFPFDFRRFEEAGRSTSMAGRSKYHRSPYYLLSRLIAASGKNVGPSTPRLVSTDDNALIEFAIPERRAVRGTDKLGYLPSGGFPVDRLRTPERDAVVLELIEHAFGTPQGRLPFSRRSRPKSRYIVDGLRNAGDDLETYAKVRQSLNDSNVAAAAKLASTLAAPVLRGRADAFVAAATADAARRREALSALPPRADIYAQRVAEGEAVLASQLPAPGPEEEPLAWLFTPQTPALEPDARATVGQALAERVAAFDSPELASRCVDLAHRSQWVELEATCRGLEATSKRNKSQGHLRLAMEAGEKGDYRRASEEFLLAHQLSPLDDSLLTLALRTALRAGRDDEVQRLREVLALRFYPREAIEDRVASLRQLNLDEERAEAAAKGPRAEAGGATSVDGGPRAP